MKNKFQVIIGLFLILVSIYTGPMGVINSLTGLGSSSLLLRVVFLLSWIVVLFVFKMILNNRYKHSKSDKFLYMFLPLMILRCLTFNQEILGLIKVNKFLELIAFVVAMLYPTLLAVFSISFLKIKNVWIKFLSVVGISRGVISLLQLGITAIYINMPNYAEHALVYVTESMVSRTLLVYLEMVSGLLLGGILVVNGFHKKGKKK